MACKKLDTLPESFDSIMSFIDDINSIKIRDDWEYIEPNSIDEIKSNSDPNRMKSKICDVNLDDSSKRVETAFKFIVWLYIRKAPRSIFDRR